MNLHKTKGDKKDKYLIEAKEGYDLLIDHMLSTSAEKTAAKKKKTQLIKKYGKTDAWSALGELIGSKLNS